MKRALNKNDIKLLTILMSVVEDNDMLEYVQDLYVEKHDVTVDEFNYVYKTLSHKATSANGAMEAYVS